MIVELEPALLERILAVGSVMSAVHPAVMILQRREKRRYGASETRSRVGVVRLCTHRHGVQVVLLQVGFGSNDVLRQVQIIQREIHQRLQLLPPPAVVFEPYYKKKTCF